MADEVSESQGEGQETESQGASNADAQAESAVADKMADIFGGNADRNEKDEQAESGVTSPDNPDGETVADTSNAATPADEDQTVSLEDATVDDLKAAEKEAAAAGDYDRATQLRNAAKAKADASSPASKAKASPVSPALQAVAKDLGGWTQTDIDEFVKANPTLARITFQRIADSYNGVSLQYAQAARNGAPQLQTQPATQQSATAQNSTATLKSLYSELDKFQEVAGSEMVEKFFKPMKTEVLDVLERLVKESDARRSEDIRREVATGFEAVTKDGFESHYGDTASLTPEQRSNRQQVANAADMIHAGALRQGVQMSYGEAIRRAHLIVNAARMQQQVRTQLVKQVKQRSTQITSRPSNRVAQVAKTGDEAAMGAVDSFWASRE